MNEQATLDCDNLKMQFSNDLLSGNADDILKTLALFLFLVAAMGQWFLGYYAADYYDDSATQNGLRLGNIKARSMDVPNKNFMNINLNCTERLTKFDPKNKGA